MGMVVLACWSHREVGRPGGECQEDVDLEKISHRVPREVMRCATKTLGAEEWLMKAEMMSYSKASTVVRTRHEDSSCF